MSKKDRNILAGVKKPRPEAEIQLDFVQACRDLGIADYTRAMKLEEVRLLDEKISGLRKKCLELNVEANASRTAEMPKEGTP